MRRDQYLPMPQDLSEIQKNWDHMGKLDPLYAIKVGIQKKGGEWESKDGGKWTLEDFFKSGVDEIESIMDQIAELNLKISYKKALDFGCGIGRVTQALGNYFDHVDGIDIAPSMINLANSYNKHGSSVDYHLNDTDNLDFLPDNAYDFIYSVEVLQHMHPRYQEKYLSELLRVLSPNGLLVFELPSEYTGLKQKIQFNFLLQNVKCLHSIYWDKILKQPLFSKMQFYCNPRTHIESFLLHKGAMHVYAKRDWRSIICYNYFVTKY
jgi:ubiquinone/menaquinone biosynthesis C-methylase UbiE